MSETGTLALEYAYDLAAVQRNFEQIQRAQVGRGPAQARVHNSANISVNSGAQTTLTFDSERWDTGNFHSTSANTNRLTAPTAGLYDIGACIRWAANATGMRQAFLRVNGTTIIDIQTVNAVAGGFNTDMELSTQYQLAATDYVEVVVTQTSGGALNVTANGNFSPEFWIQRVGSQA